MDWTLPRFAVVALVLVWCAAVLQAAQTPSQPAPPARPVTNRPIQVPANGYVSSEACAACHPENYDTWFASYHRRMTQVASPEAVAGEFDDVELELDGETYRLTRRGDEFWVDMPGPSRPGVGRLFPRVRRPVVMTTGSHHMQYYWLPTGDNRAVVMFPFAYLIDEQRWIPGNAALLQPPGSAQLRQPGQWNTNCIRCHTTNGRPRYDAGRLDSQVSEFGIACEACHGPAESHVQRRLSRPAGRGAAAGVAIDGPDVVHPGRLPAPRAAEVCGQCHGFSRFRSNEQIADWSAVGFSFRPGDELADHRLIVRVDETLDLPIMQELVRANPTYVEDRFWSDGMVRVAGREYNMVLESACFQSGEYSCLTCHSLHQRATDPRPPEEWANDLLRPGFYGDTACLQCHTSYQGEDVAAHTNHAVGSTGSQCYNCHMPYTTYGLRKSIRSHQITNPSVQTSLETGRPNACNLCHLDKPLAWTAERLSDWYGIPAPELTEDEQTVAASLLWLLRGEAGQRVLAAWTMGWEPARQASGEDWLAPFLAQLLTDPYDAVRFVAYRSLRELEGFEALDYDFVGPEEERERLQREALETWRTLSGRGGRTGETILIEAPGVLRQKLLSRLLGERDDRRVYLNE